jgi:ABC-type sugar transport system permease subunit
LDTVITTVIAVVGAIVILGGLFVVANLLVNRLSQKWDDRVRPWVFVGPALFFIFAGLVVPTIRTIYLSFRDGNRGDDGWTLSNYTETLQDDQFINFDNWTNIFTSQLFIIGVVVAAIGLFFGWRSAKRGLGTSARMDLTSPGASLGMVIAVIAILFAVFTTLRGVIWNNLWWVVAVTGLATVFGLLLAVLADRTKSETAAKSLIFMPMAISMIGAAIIWSYVYNIETPGQAQGGLNAMLTGIGLDSINGIPLPVDWLRSPRVFPWNNFFIMLIMIWIQVGFAMVVLSAAIKGVPQELQEAAKVDGASDVQVFWKITLPQIIPTIIVVVTTLIVTIMKVFDLVKATTGGNFGTEVLANVMYTNLRNGNFTLSSTFAVIIFVLVLPVMWFNFRRGRKQVTR